jgi:predicted signal transduction protein with EAL and GGDEF domain
MHARANASRCSTSTSTFSKPINSTATATLTWRQGAGGRLPRAMAPDRARRRRLVARIGGDEFAILQYRVARTTHAVGLAERILEGIGADMDVESQRLQIGASIGIALCCSPDLDPDTLMRHADVRDVRGGRRAAATA